MSYLEDCYQHFPLPLALSIHCRLLMQTTQRRIKPVVLTKLLVHGAEGASWKNLDWVNMLRHLDRNIKAPKLCSYQLIFRKKGDW